MNIWNWLYDSVEEHREKGDDSRLELYWLHRHAMKVDDDNPQAAFAALEEGRLRAHALGDGWWTLFFEHWKLQNLLHKQRDYNKARDLAARVAIEARKPAYAGLPQRICLQEDLISSFVSIDARGHAVIIEEALDYMEREAPREAECYLCLQGLRRDFLFDCGRTSEALELGRLDVAECERGDNQHHLFQSLLSQCEIELEAPWPAECLLDVETLTEESQVVPVNEGYVSVEDFENRVREVEAMARRAREITDEMKERDYDPEINMWLAHTGFLLDRADAKDNFKRAVDGFFAHNRLPSEYFFRTWMMTYWRLGSPDQALNLVQNEAKWIEGNGQIAREARLARQACLFKLMTGTLEAADIAAAREKIASLGAPQHETKRLDQLEADWNQSRENAANALDAPTVNEPKS